MKIDFFTGEQCCLCDQAQNLVSQLQSKHIEFIKVNVRQDPDTYHLYGARIPVLKKHCDATELAWPFDLLQLKEFVGESTTN